MFAGSGACARPPSAAAPVSVTASAPAEPVEPAESVAAAPAEDRAAPAAEPRGQGQSVAVAPPSPPQEGHESWGGGTGAAGGEAFGRGRPGCLPGQAGPATTRGGRRSLVRARSVAAQGALEPSLAAQILGKRAESLRPCHLEGMAGDLELAGDLRLRLEIVASGSVREAVVVETGVGLEACVVAVARAWKFPPADGDSRLDVVFELRTEVASRERPSCR